MRSNAKHSNVMLQFGKQFIWILAAFLALSIGASAYGQDNSSKQNVRRRNTRPRQRDMSTAADSNSGDVSKSAGGAKERTLANYVDNFNSAPFTGTPTGFNTGTAGTGLSYGISGGDGGTFGWQATGGSGGSGVVNILSNSWNSGTTETVTIGTRDGRAFDFNGIWLDIAGDGMTVTGFGPEPFSFTGVNGSNSPAGGSKHVTQIQITSTDFNIDFIDDIDVDIDDPGMDIQGNGVTITNGDNSPSGADDTDLGSTDVGIPTTSTFTIRNIGDAPLDLTSSPNVVFSSNPTGDFSVSAQPGSDPVGVGGSTTFTIQCNPSGVGARTARVSISNNSEADPYTFDVQCTGTADVTKPDVTIDQAGGQADPTNGSPVLFTVVFNEPINEATFTNADISVGGTATTGTVTITEIAPNDDTTFEVEIVVSADGTVVPTIPAGGVEDVAGNTNNVSTSTDNSVTYDATDPTDPTPASASHTVNVPSNDNTVEITISGATDGSGSGVDGFEVEWDKNAGWTPGQTKEQEETWTGATFSAPTDGNWYFHLATVDNAGNWTSTVHMGPFPIDTDKPDVTINQAGGQADPTASSPVLFTVVFDEPINEATFTNADISVGGTATTGTVTITEIAPNDDTTYEVSIVVTGDGSVQPTIPAGGVEDLAGNTNNASTSTDNTVNYDATKPDVTIDQAGGQADPTNASPVAFTVVFDEPINEATFTNADINVGGTATTGTVTITEIAPNDDTTFEVSIVVSADGTVVPTIPAGGVEDLVGNTNNASTSTDNSVTVETVKPDVTINQAGGQADPTGTSPVTFTAVFDEPIDDATFTNADVNVGGTATTGTVTITEIAPNDDTTFEVSIVVTGDGTVVPTIPAGGVEDIAGNTNNASTSTDNTVNYDATKPDVTIDQAGGQADPTNGSPVLFTVVFDEPINESTFTNADVSVGGTATTGTVTITEIAPNDDTTFEVSIVVTGDGTVVPTIPAGGVEDIAGNTNNASTSTDNTVNYDATKPDVTIDQAGGQADPTNGSPVLFTVVFDEPINESTFINADVSVGGTATTGAVTVTEVAPNDDTTFEVSIEVTGEGTIVPTIPAGGVEDPTGNTNTVSTSTDNSVTYDVTKPDVTINQKGSQADPTNGSPVLFTVVFNEPINDATFTNADISVGGTATTGAVTVTEANPPNDDTTFEVSIVVTADGTVVPTIPAGGVEDPAGNTNNASTSTDNSITVETVKPDVTINQAGGQVDPTNASPVAFTVVFDEPINESTFTNADVSVGGTATTGTVTLTEIAPNDDTTFEVSIVVTSDGTVQPTIPAGGVEDIAGNTNNASTSGDNSVTVDITKPDVTINQAGGQADPTNASPVTFTAVFDEPINEATFTNADVNVGGTATTGAVTVTEIAPNDDTTFEVSIVVTADGTVVPTIPAGGVEDPVGNTNTASTSTDNSVTYDVTQPDVTINQAGGQADPTNASPVTFTAVFDEPINDATFTNADVSVGGTATTGLVTVTEVAPNDDTTFEVSIVVTADGTVIPTIPAGGVEDPAGNTNTVSTSTDNSVTYDNTAPTPVVTQAGGQTDPTWSSPVNFSVDFGEDVTGFENGDINTSASTAPGALSAAVTGGPQTYNVAISGMTGDGLVTFTFNASVAQDLAGNNNNAPTLTDNQVTYNFPVAEIDVQRPASTSIADTGTDDVGNQASGVVTSLDYTIDNTAGTDQLTITSISGANQTNVTGPTSTSTFPLNVAAGATGTLNVSFTVINPGAFSFDLDINNNDGDENPYDIHIQGTGVTPEIAVKQGATNIPDDGAFDFGATKVTTSVDFTFTIENTGSANLTFTTPLVIGGAHAGDFVVAPQPTSPVAPAGNTTFEVTFTPSGHGTRTATLSFANNDVDENPFNFTLTGEGTNNPIVISDIPNQVTDEDVPTPPIPFTLTDPDAGTDQHGCYGRSQNQALVPDDNIVIQGFHEEKTVTITPAPNAFGNVLISIYGSDGYENTVETFLLTVNPVNDPPTITDIPDQTILEDFSTGPLGFTVDDIDNDMGDLTFDGTVDMEDIIPLANIVFGDGTSPNGNEDTPAALAKTVTITPAPDKNGVVEVVVTVSDGDETASDTLTVTITPVNDAPDVAGLPDIAFNEDETGSLDLDQYVTDVDNDTTELDWTVVDLDTVTTLAKNSVLLKLAIEVTATIDPTTHVVTFMPAENYNGGGGTFAFTATDPGGLADSDTMDVTVNAVNDPPVVAELPDITIAEDDSAFLDLDQFVTDADNDTTELTWTLVDLDTVTTLSKPALPLNLAIEVTATIDSTTHVVKFKPTENFNGGGGTFLFTATDPGGLSGQDTLEVTIIAINDPPVVADLPDVTFAEDDSAFLDLDQFVTDVDNDTTQLRWTVIDLDTVTVTSTAAAAKALASPEIAVTIDTATHIARFVSAANFFGAGGTFLFTATDPGGLSGQDTLTVTVTPVNDPPRFVGPLPPITLLPEQFYGFPLPLLYPLVDDVDNPDPTLIWSVEDHDHLKPVFGPDSLKFTAPAAWEGTDTLTVYISDGSLMDSTELVITISKLVDTTKPAAPTGLTATVGASSVELSWTPNIEPDIAAYVIYRSSDSTAFDITKIIGQTVHPTVTFTDNNVTPGNTYYYSVSAVDSSTNESINNPVTRGILITGIEDGRPVPTEFSMTQNYPNPFNPVTTINYTLPKATHVQIVVYNMAGQIIQTLVDENRNIGYHTVQWDAAHVPSGIYFYAIRTKEFTKIRKCMLLK